MKVAWEKLTLHAADDEFRIARERITSFPDYVVRLQVDGIVGLGEACPSEYYGETPRAIAAALARLRRLLARRDPWHIYSIVADLSRQLPKTPSLVAAVDMALYDLAGRRLGVPVYRLLGLDPRETKLTSFTLGIAEPEVMRGRARRVKKFRILKLKVGVPGDLESVAAVREVWPHAIRVDANIGWTPKEAIERIKQLAKYDIEFVEQPIPPGNNRALRRIQQAVPLPIITDESSVAPADVAPLAGCVAGINIKLMKCGGITRALQMIHTARCLGMKIMLGCMLETSIAITAAAHLTPLVDYADLDGNYLIAEDPFEGVKIVRGKLTLSEEPGLGVRPRLCGRADIPVRRP
ncbi:MAG: dipeptide epimerase [Planctomycetes bacterium]|nr:dipeptide epimerase [Planctomycetota bacterium]